MANCRGSKKDEICRFSGAKRRMKGGKRRRKVTGEGRETPEDKKRGLR